MLPILCKGSNFLWMDKGVYKVTSPLGRACKIKRTCESQDKCQPRPRKSFRTQTEQ